MITLPQDWEDKIQFRGWMKPVNEFSEIAILILLLQNTANQAYSYQQIIKLPAMDKITDEDKNKALHEAYKKILAGIKKSSKTVKYVMSKEDGYWNRKYSILDDNWTVLIDSNLKLYKE